MLNCCHSHQLAVLFVFLASQEDSSQSLASCLNLLPSPMDLPTDQSTAKECRDNNRYFSHPPLSHLVLVFSSPRLSSPFTLR